MRPSCVQYDGRGSTTSTLPDATASSNGMAVTQSDRALTVFFFSSATTSGDAEPPQSGLYLSPLNSIGLWLAVTTTPPAAPLSTTGHDTAGVGVTRSSRMT